MKRRAFVISVLPSFTTQNLGHCRLYLNTFSFSEPPPTAGNQNTQTGQQPWDELALPFPVSEYQEMEPKSQLHVLKVI